MQALFTGAVSACLRWAALSGVASSPLPSDPWTTLPFPHLTHLVLTVTHRDDDFEPVERLRQVEKRCPR